MGVDIRIQRSKAALREALLACMLEKPLQDIAVTEVCERAGLNRTTFYKYYKDITGILDELGQEQIEKFRVMLKGRTKSGEAFLRDILKSIERAKELYQVKDGGTVSERFKSGVIEAAKEYGMPNWKTALSSLDAQETSLYYEALLGGALQVALAADCKKDSAVVIKVIMNLVKMIFEQSVSR